MPKRGPVASSHLQSRQLGCSKVMTAKLIEPFGLGKEGSGDEGGWLHALLGSAVGRTYLLGGLRPGLRSQLGILSKCRF